MKHRSPHVAAALAAALLALVAGCSTPATSSFSPSTASVARQDEAWPPRRTTVRTTKVVIEPPAEETAP
jgi:hypothetical protein